MLNKFFWNELIKLYLSFALNVKILETSYFVSYLEPCMRQF